jgi:hypothetical protein
MSVESRYKMIAVTITGVEYKSRKTWEGESLGGGREYCVKYILYIYI